MENITSGILVVFSCLKCGLKDEECRAQPRLATQFFNHWFQNTVGKAVATKHYFKSPHCTNINVTIKIEQDSL